MSSARDSHLLASQNEKQAIVRAEARDPELCDNPAWRILKDDAYAQFAEAFARLP